MKNIIISLLLLVFAHSAFSQTDSLLYSFLLTNETKTIKFDSSSKYKIKIQDYSGTELSIHSNKGNNNTLVINIFTNTKAQEKSINYLYIDITNKISNKLMKLLVKNNSFHSGNRDEIIFRNGCFLIIDRISLNDWSNIDDNKISEFELASFSELNPTFNYSQNEKNKVISSKSIYKKNELITFEFAETKSRFYTNGDCKPIIMYIVLQKNNLKWTFNSSFFGPQKACGPSYDFLMGKQSIKIAGSGTYKIAWLDDKSNVWMTKKIKIIDD